MKPPFVLWLVVVAQVALIGFYVQDRIRRGSEEKIRKEIVSQIFEMAEASRGVYDAGIPDGYRDRADLTDYVAHRDSLWLNLVQEGEQEVAGIYARGPTSGVYTEFVKLFRKEPHQWSAFATVFYLDEPTEVRSDGGEVVVVAKSDKKVFARFPWPPLQRE